MRLKTFLSALCVLFFLSGPALGGQGNWTRVAEGIENALLSALKSYAQGGGEASAEAVADVYFGLFEGEEANMEIAVRRFLSLRAATRLEKGFGDLRKAMHKNAPLSEIKKKTFSLIDGIRKAADELDRKGVGLDVGYQ